MDETEALEFLAESQAVLTKGHFVFTSGRHGCEYVNKDVLYTRPIATAMLCAGLAQRFMDDNIEVVVAPAVGGVILTAWVAYHMTALTNQEDIFSTYAEREEVSVMKVEDHHRFTLAGDEHRLYSGDELVIKRPGFVLKRGYGEIVRGKRVLVVEDVLTTGGSVKKVAEATRTCGGQVIGVGALVNRGGITAQDIGVPRLEALANITLESWLETDCPMCKDGVLINTDVGKGRDFVARRGGNSTST